MEPESASDTICDSWAWNRLQRLGKRTRIHIILRTSENRPDYYILKIGQNAEKGTE